MSLTRKEKRNINAASFTDLRSFLLEELLTDKKIGISPTIEVKQPHNEEKISCLRCGFLFYGSTEKRICKTCRNYNKKLA